MANNIRILIAEDDEEDRMIIQESFNEIRQNDIICFVNDGTGIFEHLLEKPANDLPTLIILDLNMPRMNGTEVLRTLKSDKRYAHIPVIIFSTSVNGIERNTCLDLGAADYLTKPVSYKEGLRTAKYFHDFASNKPFENFNVHK